jgi:hypothetical protein
MKVIIEIFDEKKLLIINYKLLIRIQCHLQLQ